MLINLEHKRPNPMLEIWARGVDKRPLESFEKDPKFEKVDTSGLRVCPYCGKQPIAYISKKKDVGIIRCCIFSAACVSEYPDAYPDAEPVKVSDLWRQWGKYIVSSNQ